MSRRLDLDGISLTPGQKAAVEAVESWLGQAGTRTTFHLACPYETGAQLIVGTLLRQLDADQVVLAAPTGREAQSLAGRLGVDALTIHRLAYRAEQTPNGTVFKPRGDGPLHAPHTRLIVVMRAHMLKAREAAHLLAAGKPLLLVSDPRETPAVSDRYLEARAPDHLVEDLTVKPELHYLLEVWNRDLNDRVAHTSDLVEDALARAGSGAWFRFNPAARGESPRALALALAARLPNALVLGDHRTLKGGDVFQAAFGAGPASLVDAQRAAQDGRPVVVLSDDGLLAAPTSLAAWARTATVLLVTTSGPSGPVSLVDAESAQSQTPSDAVLLRRSRIDEALTLEIEGTTPTRIVAIRNDHVRGIAAGDVFRLTREAAPAPEGAEA